MTDPISLGASEHQLQRRHAVVAATIATAIEWYDFLYSTVTGLVFAKSVRSGIGVGPSLGYRLASVGAAGPEPLIATWLFRTFQSTTAITIYIALCAVTMFVATAALSEYVGDHISGEHRMLRSRADVICAARAVSL